MWEILVVLRKILIFSKVVFGNYTVFVVDCTALGRVVLPDGTARHFVTRAAPSPRALRGSLTYCVLSCDKSNRETMSMNVGVRQR